MTQLIMEMRSLTKTVCKNHRENDRRLTRMEVGINKTLVRLGDITRLNAARSPNSREDSIEDLHHRGAPSYGESSRQQRRENFGGPSRQQRREDFGGSSKQQRRDNVQSREENFRNFVEPRGHLKCDLPILSLNELTALNQQLMDWDFFTFLVSSYKIFTLL